MRIFLTGASGFIGSALIAELRSAGHQVVGMVRSDAGAAAVMTAGATPYRGDLGDLDSLRRGAEEADGVIHTAFNHDFSDVANFAAHCEADRRAVEALASGLEGTGRPLIVTSGTAGARTEAGRPALESDPALPVEQMPRAASEESTLEAASRGIRAMIVRLPQVHDPRKQGLISYLVPIAREKGVCAYIGDGTQQWSAAHVSDVARLYRLVLERGESGRRYHAVGEEGVAMRAITGVLGRGLGLPVRSIPGEEALAHFGWLGFFAGRDLRASSEATRRALGWNPTGPGLLEDLERMEFAEALAR